MISIYLRRAVCILSLGALTALTAFGQSKDTDTTSEKAEPAMIKKQDFLPMKVTTEAENETAATAESTRNFFAESAPYSDASKKAPASPGRQTTDSDWHIAMAPYLYVTGLNGTVGARGRTIEIDLSFADVIGDFKIGLMGAIEARKNRFVLVNDIIWLRLGEELDNPPTNAFASTDVKVKMFQWDAKAGYRVLDGDGGSLDLLGGFRLMSLENELNTTTGLLPGFNVSERKTWATPIGGIHGVANVTDKVFITTLFDIGGGWGSDITLQAYGGMGYRLNPKVSLVGGWRYVKTDYNDNTGFVFDTTMNGLIFGARIQLR